jgi:hypothetical protein
MEELDRQLLAENLLWRRLLTAYLETAEQVASPPQAGGPRWCGRISALEDADIADVATAHGELIALGWLKFQLEDGRSGLVYRVSGEGRRALGKASAEAAATDDDAASARAA